MVERGVAHPGELLVDRRQPVLGIIGRPADRLEELSVASRRRRGDDFEVEEHAAGVEQSGDLREEIALAACSRWWMANPETITSNVPSGVMSSSRSHSRTSTRGSSANRSRAWASMGGDRSTATTCSMLGRSSSTRAASRPSPHPRSSTARGVAGRRSAIIRSPARRASSLPIRPRYQPTCAASDQPAVGESTGEGSTTTVWPPGPRWCPPGPRTLSPPCQSTASRGLRARSLIWPPIHIPGS